MPSTFLKNLLCQLDNTTQGSNSIDEYFLELKHALRRASEDNPIWTKYFFTARLNNYTAKATCNSSRVILLPFLCYFLFMHHYVIMLTTSTILKLQNLVNIVIRLMVGVVSPLFPFVLLVQGLLLNFAHGVLLSYLRYHINLGILTRP